MSEADKKGGAYEHEQDAAEEEDSANKVEYLGPSRKEILERQQRIQRSLVEHSSYSSD